MVWGGTFVVVQDALADASVFVFLALRFVIATAALAFIYWRELRDLKADAVRAGALTGCCMFGGYAFQTLGLRLTTPSKAAFITTFSVALVPIFLAVFAGRRIGARIWGGTGLAVIGLTLLTFPAAGLVGLNRGDMLVLACAVAFALHIIAIGHYTRRYSTGAFALLQIATTAAATLVMLPLLAAAGWESPRAAWTMRLIVAAVVTGVLATALVFLLQAWAQRSTTASRAAILFTLEPVFAAVTSYVFLGERLGWKALAGAALILCGILVAELAGLRINETE
jgi:drug/metabolite transporter (DMT)-like permease